MTKVFIGGSRRISRLSPDVRRRLERIIDQRIPVVVGDAKGADKAVQQFLHSNNFDLVEVFCTEGECRNNIGLWPVRTISTSGNRRDFNFYAAKDRVMADEASVGFMIWDGKSVGTLMNMFRLVRGQKKVAIYVATSKNFVDLKNESDWEQFTTCFPSDLRLRFERQAKAENFDDGALTQANLL